MDKSARYGALVEEILRERSPFKRRFTDFAVG
jgi:hypothetical protein